MDPSRTSAHVQPNSPSKKASTSLTSKKIKPFYSSDNLYQRWDSQLCKCLFAQKMLTKILSVRQHKLFFFLGLSFSFAFHTIKSLRVLQSIIMAPALLNVLFWEILNKLLGLRHYNNKAHLCLHLRVLIILFLKRFNNFVSKYLLYV